MTEKETQTLIDAIQPNLEALVVLLAEKRQKHAQKSKEGYGNSHTHPFMMTFNLLNLLI